MLSASTTLWRWSKLLTVLTLLLGFGLGKGVPRLVQRSGSLARRSQVTQLTYGTLLLLPWLVGIAMVVKMPLLPELLLPAIGQAAGMGWGRRHWGEEASLFALQGSGHIAVRRSEGVPRSIQRP